MCPSPPDGRRLLEALVRAGERERREIAASIQGDTLQPLGALRLKLAALASHLHAPEQRRAIAEIEGTLVLATERLRARLFELWPPSLERNALAETISELVADSEREGLSTRGEVDLRSEVPIELRGVIYRAIAEALANIRQHARASSVEVALGEADGIVWARIRDDGVGFDPSAAPFGHNGLREMSDRVHAVGGSIEIRSAPAQGTEIQLSVPVRPRGQVDSKHST
ncbi:MAG: hypothetical protein JO169_08075 [Solirubrobacterales bacterium]|nr:hypothetical protein [Solirubrobacterales bacterium]